MSRLAHELPRLLLHYADGLYGLQVRRQLPCDHKAGTGESLACLLIRCRAFVRPLVNDPLDLITVSSTLDMQGHDGRNP